MFLHPGAAVFFLFQWRAIGYATAVIRYKSVREPLKIRKCDLNSAIWSECMGGFRKKVVKKK
jgi:hypothetical protein